MSATANLRFNLNLLVDNYQPILARAEYMSDEWKAQFKPGDKVRIARDGKHLAFTPYWNVFWNDDMSLVVDKPDVWVVDYQNDDGGFLCARADGGRRWNFPAYSLDPVEGV